VKSLAGICEGSAGSREVQISFASPRGDATIWRRSPLSADCVTITILLCASRSTDLKAKFKAMTIDPYALCPGGTGKKLKFCCPDLLTELEKVQRMVEGEQYVACLEYVEGLEQRYPDRACLLSLKTMMQTQLRMTDKAAETLGRFMEKYPDNPVALAEQSALRATREGAVAGIDTLQSALEASGREMPSELYSAIAVVAEAALAEGMFPAARAHLMLQMSIAGREDERPLSLLIRLNGSPSVPLLLKQDMRYPSPPDDALWKNSFTKALEPANRGAWRAAARNLEKLAAEVGDWPVIWQSIAILKMMIGDHPGAVVAWRKFTAQPNVPLDDAVEAEAVAQMLDPETYADETDVVLVTYPIPDMEQVLARLQSDKRIARMDIDLTQLGREGEPPPKAAFWLLDRLMPATGVGLSRSDVPNVIGQLFVFGRQTDREARLELVAFRDPELEPAKKMVGEVAGNLLGAAGPEQVESQVPTAQHALSWNWRLPDDTPLEHRRKLLDEQRREVILERWPKLSLRFLDGRAPERAAQEPQYRIKVLAAILLLETSGESTGEAFDYNELRRKLGLPSADPIDPAQYSVADLPLVRLARLEVKKLSDDDLMFAFQRTQHYRHVAALRELGMEVVSRPSLDTPSGGKGQIDKSEVYGVLAQVEPDAGAALGYIEKARELAKRASKSCAPWDIAELTLRIARQDLHEAQHLIQHIQQSHLREPGVAQAFVHVLVEAGILNPDGTPAALPGEAAPGIVVPGAPAPAGGNKIWTPGAEPAAGGAKKSAIWTPD